MCCNSNGSKALKGLKSNNRIKAVLYSLATFLAPPLYHLYQHRAQSHVQQQADSRPASSLSPRTKRRQHQRTRAEKAALKQAHQQQQQQQRQQALHAAFHPAASVDNVPPATRLVLGRPLDPVLDLAGHRGRAGLGHSMPTLMDLDPQSKSVAQVSSGSLLPPAAASMEVTDGPSTSDVPAAVADPTLAAGPTPADTPMLPAAPLSVTPDFPDTAVSSAMCLWAEDVDIPVDIARQAVLYVHAKFASELSPHPAADCTCLSKPLQELMVTAVKAVTGDASFHLLTQTRSQTAQQRIQPQTTMGQTAPPCQPHQQSQLWQPPDGTSRRVLESAPCSPWGGSMSHPRTPSLQLLSLNVNGLRERQKRAALFAVLQAGPWHVIALQETHLLPPLPPAQAPVLPAPPRVIVFYITLCSHV